MAKFRFKLQSVLHHRQVIEDHCQRDLAKLVRQRMILHDQLRQIQQALVDSKHQLADGLVGMVDMTRVGRFARFSGQVNFRANMIVRQLAGLEQQLQKAQETYLSARRDRKALDLLRKKQYRAWQRTLLRREASRLDDVASQIYMRNRNTVMELDS